MSLETKKLENKGKDATTQLVGVVFPTVHLQAIDRQLEPMQNRQDWIRAAVKEKLEAQA